MFNYLCDKILSFLSARLEYRFVSITLCADSCLFHHVSAFSFVKLLEYAEEVLLCNHVIVYFKKNRADQRELI